MSDARARRAKILEERRKRLAELRSLTAARAKKRSVCCALMPVCVCLCECVGDVHACLPLSLLTVTCCSLSGARAAPRLQHAQRWRHHHHLRLRLQPRRHPHQHPHLRQRLPTTTSMPTLTTSLAPAPLVPQHPVRQQVALAPPPPPPPALGQPQSPRVVAQGRCHKPVLTRRWREPCKPDSWNASRECEWCVSCRARVHLMGARRAGALFIFLFVELQCCHTFPLFSGGSCYQHERLVSFNVTHTPPETFSLASQTDPWMSPTESTSKPPSVPVRVALSRVSL